VHLGGGLMAWPVVRVLSLPVLWFYQIVFPCWLRTLAAQDHKATDGFTARGDHNAAVRRLYLSRYRLYWADEIIQSAAKH
jgi:hypothetical protein